MKVIACGIVNVTSVVCRTFDSGSLPATSFVSDDGEYVDVDEATSISIVDVSVLSAVSADVSPIVSVGGAGSCINDSSGGGGPPWTNLNVGLESENGSGSGGCEVIVADGANCNSRVSLWTPRLTV